MDLVSRYIQAGRFGAFVSEFCDIEYNRLNEEAEKDTDLKLWIAYVHSYSNVSYDEWKKRVIGESATKAQPRKTDTDLDDNGIQAIVDGLFSTTTPQKG